MYDEKRLFEAENYRDKIIVVLGKIDESEPVWGDLCHAWRDTYCKITDEDFARYRKLIDQAETVLAKKEIFGNV